MLSLRTLACALGILLSVTADVRLVLAQAPPTPPRNGTASFRHIGKDEGLSQSSVFSIAQDSVGFMWFGTRDGLNRFDGYDFTHYRPDTTDGGPLGNDIRAITYHAQDRALWVGSTDGLSRYDPRRDRFEKFPGVHGAVRSIHVSGGGQLWVGTSLGLYCRKRAGEAFVEVAIPGADLTEINAVLTTPGALYVGTDGGLLRFRKTGNTYALDTRPLPDPTAAQHSVKALYLSPNGALFFGTFADGLYRYHAGSNTLRHYRHEAGDETSLPHDNVRALYANADGQLWVGTFKGLGLLDLNTERFTVIRAGGLRGDELSDESIRSLFVDQRGSLWTGTYYGGVNQLDPNNDRFQTYVRTVANRSSVAARDNSIGADIISSFAEDGRGNLYVGTEGGGLDYLRVGSGEFEHFRHDASDPASISGPNVKSLQTDGDYVWVGTFNRGLNRLDRRTGTFRHYRAPTDEEGPRPSARQLANDNVYALAKRDNLLWTGTYGGGLSILDVAADTFRNTRYDAGAPLRQPSDFVRVIYSTPDQVLVGSDAGLHRVLLDADGYPRAYETLLEDTRVTVVHLGENGQVWAGTLSSGLFVIDEAAGAVRQITVADGLPGNSVFGILADERGRLWLSTNDGLARYLPATGVLTTFSHPSGLLDGEFNFGAYAKLTDGEMVFGSLRGFIRFDPARIDRDGFLPPLAFTHLVHRGRTVRPGEDQVIASTLDQTDEITFAYGDASFAVGLAALDYVAPESNRLEYKLDGLDADWTPARGKALATYTIQREGEYILRVRSANSDGLVNPNERALLIRVLPPPWRTLGAYVLYGLLALAAVFGIYRFTHLRHQYQLEHLARERDEELHEGKLRFFTNITHEFRTPLTLIVGPIDDLLRDRDLPPYVRERLERVEKNSKRLLDLVDRVLTFRKLSSEHGRLRPARLELNWFLRKLNEPFADEALRRGIDMRFDIPLQDLEVWVDGRMLEMAVTAVLSNAMKFTPDGGKISLSAKRLPDDTFEIRVVDNGRGVPEALKGQIFQRYFEDPTSSRGVGSGIGLAVAKDLMALHGGTIRVEDTPGGGATFVMTLPVGSLQLAADGKRFDESLKELAVTTEVGDIEEARVARAVLAVDDEALEESAEAVIVGARAPARERLLIVEDNQELRDYLASIFADAYEVVTAEDGSRGLAEAQGSMPPDVILSDVMMPVMDGREMCRRLKTDLKTSHIPVLLLTAKTSETARLDGLRIGADDYIAKPFLPEELQLRVRNTLNTRARIRESFARVVNLEPREISVTSADEEFLIAAMAFVEEHIDDIDLNVNRMAQALNVSRALLFTKVKALTDQTPSNFVKTVRLKRAAQLLATAKLNVSEVAYHVGFRDPKYFNKCFKKAYGVSASGYMEREGVG